MKKIKLPIFAAMAAMLFTFAMTTIPSVAKAMHAKYEMFRKKWWQYAIHWLSGLLSAVDGVTWNMEFLVSNPPGTGGHGQVKIDYATMDVKQAASLGITTTDGRISFRNDVVILSTDDKDMVIKAGSYQVEVDEEGSSVFDADLAIVPSKQ